MKSLRRGFGCYWASRVPAQVLQKLMRHSNIRITMDYYANVDDAAMQTILGRESLLRNTSRNTEAGGPVTRSQTDSTTPVE
jgi:integrase